ncbi:cytochrome P450 [Actinokineospora auranticolor]|uniref:cytochrome P450 n=1 Tax=Actinokineospora auranticolor TaxID=155976 RepID=UPI0015E390E4|nr:cytochrome P450 [Actinokineospora auranticolor]
MTSVVDRLRNWKPDIRRPIPGPGESLPPGPRAPLAYQSVRVWGSRNTYFPALQRRYGDTFLIRTAPLGEVVVLCDPADVRRVALGGPDLFPVAENNALFVPLLGARTVLALDGEPHRRERRRMTPPLHGERVARAVSIMERLASDEVASWPVGRTFKLVEGMRRLTLRVIVKVVLGVDDPARAERLIKALHRVIDVKVLDMLMWTWPRLADHGPWRRAVEALEHADTLLYEEIARRRADPDRDARPDVLAMLLDGEPDDDLVRVELLTLLTGGYETTAVASAWMFERVLRHPAVLARLRDGLDDDKDDYRTAVIKETLRLRPVSYNVGRKTTRPTDLGGHRIPAGTFVWPSLAALHTDPETWGPNPHTFDPERWFDPAVPTKAFLPFGGGVHRCLGAVLAQVEMDVILRTVLRQVDIHPTHPRDEPQTMRNIVLVPKHGTKARVTRRRTSAR